MSQHSTNVVNVMLSSAFTKQQALTYMQYFGDIAQVGRVGSLDASSALAVGYYDIRHAAAAMQALGNWCWPGAPVGDHTVRLSGTTEMPSDVARRIKAIYSADNDTDDFICEFFDLRDAERYRKASKVSSQAKDDDEPTDGGLIEVMISGIPNAMLSDAMMEVILEQANLWGISHFTTKARRNYGDVFVSFTDRRAAERCLSHFKTGACGWGSNVSSQIISDGDGQPDAAIAGLPGLSADEIMIIKMEAREDVARGDDMLNEETFGSDALQSWSFEQQVAANAKLLKPMKAHLESETSTDVSESEIEELKVAYATNRMGGYGNQRRARDWLAGR